MNHLIRFCMPCAAALALCSLSFSTKAQTSGDADFAKKAYMGGCAEIAAGNLAIEKSKNASVVELAKMMVADHTDANAKLQSLSKDLSQTDSLDAKHKAMKASLMSLSGDAFDKAYLKGQVADHQAAIALFKQESASGTYKDLKSFATETLPKLQMHLDHVNMVAKK